MNDEKCRFFTGRKHYNCNALMNTKCNGMNTDCSFYKTDEQYHEDSDRAVLINRARGNCEKCKYKLKQCKLLCE